MRTYYNRQNAKPQNQKSQSIVYCSAFYLFILLSKQLLNHDISKLQGSYFNTAIYQPLLR